MEYVLYFDLKGVQDCVYTKVRKRYSLPIGIWFRCFWGKVEVQSVVRISRKRYFAIQFFEKRNVKYHGCRARCNPKRIANG